MNPINIARATHYATVKQLLHHGKLILFVFLQIGVNNFFYQANSPRRVANPHHTETACPAEHIPIETMSNLCVAVLYVCLRCNWLD